MDDAGDERCLVAAYVNGVQRHRHNERDLGRQACCDSRADRHQQAVPGREGQRPRQPARQARRDPRRAGRERRRQVDDDEDDLRRRPPDEGEIRWNGQAVQIASPSLAGACAGHQHGLPALQPVRHADRGGERLAGLDKACRWPRSARIVKVAWIRPGRRAAAPGAHLGGRAPARRDRARAAHRPEAADPRRADLGARRRRRSRSCSSRCASWPTAAAPSSTSATSSTRSARCATTARCCAAARSPARSTRRRRATPACRA